jgi:hypothetical protein
MPPHHVLINLEGPRFGYLLGSTLSLRCCGQRQPGHIFYIYALSEIIIGIRRSYERYKSFPLRWFMIYGDRSNWNDNDRNRYGIVQYGVLS